MIRRSAEFPHAARDGIPANRDASRHADLDTRFRPRQAARALCQSPPNHAAARLFQAGRAGCCTSRDYC